jgi:hypothetical protein
MLNRLCLLVCIIAGTAQMSLANSTSVDTTTTALTTAPTTTPAPDPVITLAATHVYADESSGLHPRLYHFALWA